ncbi:MAG: quinolinate synthase NadA [Bacteroidales bacterium]|jgi:quinolinate synthase|nr:quinolinate synthase NadA [Bacteroidales bacterium]MDD2425879.1 quinolinate synthase NadA [Bacteroidales bacterium]MDD3989667.1 quinolinate synthase NadA [Bacteroidales bacterium]MDD4638606.1 quinolinate synthase NadA [Bacteroidales bacterium]
MDIKGISRDKQQVIEEIIKIKNEKRAVILAHYYTLPEIQDICDYLGDSLGLSQQAASTDSPLIVFCGVNFMAETASIISPDKKVIVPDNTAGCSLAESITGSDLLEWKRENPTGVVVSYVNTTADVKAYTDICCTSANALRVIESIPAGKKILFVPDKNLGEYIRYKSGREMEIWPGSCCVHQRFTSRLVLDLAAKYPKADILIHPESSCSADPQIHNMSRAWFYSTSGMINHVQNSKSDQFVIVTEKEIIHRMKQICPSKEYISVDVPCRQMKKSTLEKLLSALRSETPGIKVEAGLREMAYPSIERMLRL